MKAFGYILISALAIYTLVPTSGYEVQPLYGRTFNLFNLLTSPQALLSRLTSLTSRFAILQSTVDILSSQFTALKNLVTSLQAQITALQNPIKKCPLFAGKTIASIPGKCFIVKTVTEAITWDNAQIACSPGGGLLAEPTPAATASFYTALKSKFPTEFGIIEGATPKQMWIGYKSALAADTNVVAQTSGVSVKFTTTQDPIFAAAAVAGPWGAVINAAIPTGTTLAVGTSWSTADLTTAAPKAFICQYNFV